MLGNKTWLLYLFIAVILTWAIYSCTKTKSKGFISAHTSLIGSNMLYLAILIFIKGKQDLKTWAEIPGYLLVFVGGFIGWFLNKLMWEKYDKMDEEQEKQAAANVGNY